MRRIHAPEHLDRSRLDEDELARALEEVAAVNRWLGGYRALRLHLRDLDGEVESLRVLDVGAGDAATLRHLRKRAPDAWRFVGAEIHPQVATLAGERIRDVEGVELVRADGLRLPFPDRSFDAVLCTLTLHHFDDAGAVALVREMARVCRRRVVVNDLERSLPHYLGALLLARTVWRTSPITRHDGPLSVRRSFTPDELRDIGRRAGLWDVRVSRHPLFRLVLEGGPAAAAPRPVRSREGAAAGSGNGGGGPASETADGGGTRVG